MMNAFIFITAFAAVFLSSMSGCGSGLITIPTWIILGYPLPIAIACDKICSCFWTPIAAKNYLSRTTMHWRLIIPMAALGVLGSLAAAVVVIHVDEVIMRPIIGGIILIVLALVALQKDFGLQESKKTSGDKLMQILGLPFGFYEGFFGAGNGIFTAYAFSRIKGFSLVTSLGNYYVMAFVWCLCSLSVITSRGYYNIPLFVSAVIGSSLGGYLGSRVGVTMGSGFVKKVFIVLGTLLGLKLILGC
jgi:uncharacterized protein